ncbi:MAG: B12-binding domain-containing radical SAM protein [Deltaproteobacteria bacterium]|jgi:radical SAM superfamily enzyme YgiQ (UPF0313 family)|nr:B12-binding domain-containing radical SAM protein [Deltaproteobacteria bacterium]
MKILLIHPKRRNKHSYVDKIKAYIPPLTLPVLAGLTPRDIDVELCDESVDEVNFNTDANLIGITGITSQINRGYELADIFRKKGKKVIMGGIHVSAMPNEAKKHADSIVIGEAEDLWEGIIEDFRNDCLREEYKADKYTDLKKLVIPKFDLLKLNRYRGSAGTNIPRLPIQTSRGCPFNCKFCSVTKFWGPKIRTKPLENIEKELLYIKSLGTNRIFFTDDNFIADISYTKDIIELLKKYNFYWFCQVSTNIYRHEDLIVQMSQAGCTGVYIGIETFSEENLTNINKKFNTMADYKKLMRLFNRYNIRVMASMMVGLDGDTKETLEQMVQQLIFLKVSYAQFYLLMLLPGTKLRDQFLKENRIIDFNWDHQNGTVVTYIPKFFQGEELQNYYWDLYKEFYSCKSIFKRLFTSNNLKGGVNKIVTTLKTNFYFWKRIKSGLHPLEN